MKEVCWRRVHRGLWSTAPAPRSIDYYRHVIISLIYFYRSGVLSYEPIGLIHLPTTTSQRAKLTVEPRVALLTMCVGTEPVKDLFVYAGFRQSAVTTPSMTSTMSVWHQEQVQAEHGSSTPTTEAPSSTSVYRSLLTAPAFPARSASKSGVDAQPCPKSGTVVDFIGRCTYLNHHECM